MRTESPLAGRCAGIGGLEIAEVAANPLSAALAARGCALVHAHEERAAYSGWLLKLIARTPYVVTRRVHHVNSRSLGRRLAWRAADHVAAVSASIARSVTAHFANLAVSVVPDAHAGMQDDGERRRNVLAHLEGKTVVGHVGELHHAHKGQGTIIEAASIVRESRPELRFVLVGEGRDRDRLRGAAAGLGNVELVGFVDNVEDYLAAFDVFVYPSLFEGLGSTLLDAMAFGLPIVASNVGGIPEVVEDGVNGLLIPPGRPDELASALVRLVDDATLRASMARENRARAAQFTAARMADAYEAIYRSILEPDPRTGDRHAPDL